MNSPGRSVGEGGSGDSRGGIRDRSGVRVRVMRPEVPDVALARKLEKAHAVRLGIFQGAAVIPVVVIDVIGRDHSPGAIGAAPAMNEDRRAVLVFENREYGTDLSLCGRDKPCHRYVYVLHARSGNSPFFLVRAAAGFAEIDDRPDTKMGEIIKPFIGRLTAAVDVRVDPVKIINTGC